MECSILNDGNSIKNECFVDKYQDIYLESFKDFTEDDFDIKLFSANVLQTKIVTDYLQHLNELIRTLDAEIKQQVEELFFIKKCFIMKIFRYHQMRQFYFVKHHQQERLKMFQKICNLVLDH